MQGARAREPGDKSGIRPARPRTRHSFCSFLGRRLVSLRTRRGSHREFWRLPAGAAGFSALARSERHDAEEEEGAGRDRHTFFVSQCADDGLLRRTSGLARRLGARMLAPHRLAGRDGPGDVASLPHVRDGWNSTLACARMPHCMESALVDSSSPRTPQPPPRAR